MNAQEAIESIERKIEEKRLKLWSVGLSGLSGMHYKVIAYNFDEALAKTKKLAEDIGKEPEEGFVRDIEWISLEDADVVK